jgi:molybdate transport system substrate-binding protein
MTVAADNEGGKSAPGPDNRAMLVRWITWLAVMLGAAGVRAETLRVGAAISLKDALGEIAQRYEAASGDKIELSYGSSGQIAAQIRGGAELDLVISAAAKQIDELEKEKLVDANSRKVVAGNTLVLIVPADAKAAPRSFAALGEASVTRIAVAEPKTVPAGAYADQVFKALKISDAVFDKLVYGTNVRQVLSYVERGEVSAGVVYATDARQSGDKVKVVATADETAHEPIVYPAAIVSVSRKREAAARFLAYLGDAAAREVLRNKGFALPGTSTAATSQAAQP